MLADNNTHVSCKSRGPLLYVSYRSGRGLFTLITEFSRVRVRGSSRRSGSELKFSGNNLESSINSPERISFTSLTSSSCTESKVCWDAEEIQLISFALAALIAVEFRVSWTAKGTLPSLDEFLSGTTAWEEGEEPVKAFTAAWAAAAAVCSIVSLMVAWTKDLTWVNWLSDSILSSEELRFNRSWTCCCNCWNCFWTSMLSPPFWAGGGAPIDCVFCRVSLASLSRSTSAERVPAVGRLSWSHKVRRSFTNRLSRSRSAGMLTGSPAATRPVRR